MNPFMPFPSPRAIGETVLRLTQASVLALLAACAATPPEAPPEAPPATAQRARPQAPAPAVPPEEEQALRDIVLAQARLYRVAAPLMVNNAALCQGQARHLLGFTARNRYSYPAAYQHAAQKLLLLDDRLQIMDVLPGSGAERVGMLPGDILGTVEDRPAPRGPRAELHAASLLAPLTAQRSAIRMTVLRKGHSILLHVPLTHACAFGIELGNSDDVLALSDGRRILVSRGLLRMAESDEELAFVLAREIAHSVLSHRKESAVLLGKLIDELGQAHPDPRRIDTIQGPEPLPPRWDLQADRLAFYMLARAGYRLEIAAPFSSRLAAPAAVSSRISYGVLHPLTAERLAAMQKTWQEIRALQERGKPLMP